MKTKFIYTDPGGVRFCYDVELWSASHRDGWTCRVEVGETFRTTKYWVLVYGNTVNLKALNSEWIVVENDACIEEGSSFGTPIVPERRQIETSADIPDPGPEFHAEMKRFNDDMLEASKIHMPCQRTVTATPGKEMIYNPDPTHITVRELPTVTADSRCECGADTCRTTHSTWCPKWK